MRYCKQCGKEIIKKPIESKKYFAQKLYCCMACYGKGKIKKKPEKSIEQIEKDNRRDFRAGYCTRAYTHPLYDTWRNMKRRCYGNYKNSKYYKNYGGRGITVCDEWKDDFNVFLKWALENKWEHGLTIDRKDNNGNYCPDNCQWITQGEQLLNRRNNVFITYNGETKTIKEWSGDLGLSQSALKKRLVKWDDINRAMEEPIHKNSIRYKKKGA